MKQSTLASFAKAAKKLTTDSHRYKAITRSITEMCAIDMRPISIVDGQGFKNYSYALDPSYIVLSHNTIGTYVRKSYQDAKEALVEIIKAQDAVAFTTDISTSHATESYLTLTCHFINDSFEMRSQMLAMRKMLERHTGANISKEIEHLIHEFQLPPIGFDDYTDILWWK